jgi:uncharacterized protein YjbJ (UPF0337 family)
VNRNRAKGLGKQVKGAAKEATSKVTGNKLGQAEGKMEKGVGKAQTKLGNKQAESRRPSSGR